MSILASKRGNLEFDRGFSKELFTEVSANLKVFSDKEWESVEGTLEYKKILIAVYIRTNKENLVLIIDNNKFASIMDVPAFITNSGTVYANTLIDAGYVCGKDLIESVFEFKTTSALERLVVNSSCFPVGVVETLKKYAVVFNVVIDESLLRDSDIVLKPGFHFHPIETLHLMDSLQRDISKSLVLIKK